MKGKNRPREKEMMKFLRCLIKLASLGVELLSRQKKELDGNYIDITDLLTLPQKEAAMRLGISESMLCKRFKECTRRKWPFRYLRKIEKTLKMKPEDIITKEDQEKIKKLTKEREECLRPVKIRITSLDRLLSAQAQHAAISLAPSSPISGDGEQSEVNSPSSSPILPCGDSSPLHDAEETETTEDERCVLETLQMMKSSSPSKVSFLLNDENPGPVR